jgi:hypothetical protein
VLQVSYMDHQGLHRDIFLFACDRQIDRKKLANRPIVLVAKEPEGAPLPYTEVAIVVPRKHLCRQLQKMHGMARESFVQATDGGMSNPIKREIMTDQFGRMSALQVGRRFRSTRNPHEKYRGEPSTAQYAETPAALRNLALANKFGRNIDTVFLWQRAELKKWRPAQAAFNESVTDELHQKHQRGFCMNGLA